MKKRWYVDGYVEEIHDWTPVRYEGFDSLEKATQCMALHASFHKILRGNYRVREKPGNKIVAAMILDKERSPCCPLCGPWDKKAFIRFEKFFQARLPERRGRHHEKV
jgi:hypothetical protein